MQLLLKNISVILKHINNISGFVKLSVCALVVEVCEPKQTLLGRHRRYFGLPPSKPNYSNAASEQLLFGGSRTQYHFQRTQKQLIARLHRSFQKSHQISQILRIRIASHLVANHRLF